MTITIELTPELEQQVRESAMLHDLATVRRLLAEAAAPIAESLVLRMPSPLNLEEFDALVRELDAELDADASLNIPALSNYAVSREGIYEDHP